MGNRRNHAERKRMNTIQDYNDEELFIELEGIQQEISMGEFLLGKGITEYGGHESVEDMINGNKQIEETIIEELKRRDLWERYNDNSR